MSISTYCEPALFAFSLTGPELAAILAPLFSMREAGRENLIKPRPNRPLLNAVFLRLYILKAVLIRLSSFMACFCGQRSALAAPWCSFSPRLSTPPNTVRSISGGYSTYQGGTAMKSQNQSVQNSGQINHSLSEAALASVELAIEALLDLDGALQAMPNNDEARHALTPAFHRVAEIHKAVRTYEAKKKLSEEYPVQNRGDFFVLICKTDELAPTVWRDQLMLMKKNHQAEIDDVVLVNTDYQNPRIEFCAVAGIYPAVCVAAKAQLLEILPDGSVSKPR